MPPRSHQMRLFMTPADWRTVLSRIGVLGGTDTSSEWVVIHGRSTRNEPILLQDMDAGPGMPDSGQRYLVLADDVVNVRMEHAPRAGHWYVDDLRSPVVQLSLGNLNSERLIAGRLYYASGYYQGTEWIVKHARFLESARRLSSRLKSRLSKAPASSPGYMGPEASSLVAADRIRLSTL